MTEAVPVEKKAGFHQNRGGGMQILRTGLPAGG